LKAIDERLANSKLFKEFMLKDTEIGLLNDINNVLWPIPFTGERIQLGYVHIVDQIAFMAETPNVDYVLEVSSERVDWTSFLLELQALPNVKGISGTGLHMENLLGFPNLEIVGLGDNCKVFDAGAFSSLKYLSGSFDEGTRGIENAPKLKILSMGFSPSKKFDFDSLLGLSSLEYLKITLGRYENLKFLRNCKKLRVLNLEPATWLQEVQGLSALGKLEIMLLERGKKVKDWDKFPYLENLSKVQFNECGEMNLPALLAHHPAFVNGNYYRSKPVFGK
jgi:hypothetical protein